MTTLRNTPTRPSSPEAWWRTLCFVTPQLAVSGDLDTSSATTLSRDLAKLLNAGITDIIDTRKEVSDEKAVLKLHPHIRYHHVPTDDDGYGQPGDWFSSGVQAALTAFKDPHRKVLVHCHMGVNRAPSMVFAVLLALDYDPVNALDTIRANRPIAAVLYAEDALAWYHQEYGVHASKAAHDALVTRRWLYDNKVDTGWIISRIATAHFS